MNVVTMPIGTQVQEYCKQFNCSNKIVKTRNDDTGLNRQIAYFKFVDRPREREFALWQHEIDGGSYTLTSLNL